MEFSFAALRVARFIEHYDALLLSSKKLEEPFSTDMDWISRKFRAGFQEFKERTNVGGNYEVSLIVKYDSKNSTWQLPVVLKL